MTGKDIIESVLHELDIKAPTLAVNIGLEYQRIYDIQKGKTKKVSNAVAEAIIAKYPQFNISWILSGVGNMLNSTSVKGDRNTANYGEISGSNNVLGESKVTYNNSINLTLPEKGNVKIIRPDGSVETQQQAPVDNCQQVIDSLNNRIKELEENNKVKDRLIDTLEKMVAMLEKK